VVELANNRALSSVVPEILTYMKSENNNLLDFTGPIAHTSVLARRCPHPGSLFSIAPSNSSAGPPRADPPSATAAVICVGRSQSNLVCVYGPNRTVQSVIGHHAAVDPGYL